MRKLYAERRDATIAYWENTCALPQPGGVRLILRFKGLQADRDLFARMHTEGPYAEALSDWSMLGDGAPAVLFNFTDVDLQHTAEKLGQRILKLL
ncbi:hypothetical protein ACO0LO_10675 [Undibacterium sp. TJN25]|uniref:hypothetical protein n=1 Tax=Undibacterium sp. TJN25 TaxID=3413056 RepID=UPI003BF3F6B5